MTRRARLSNAVARAHALAMLHNYVDSAARCGVRILDERGLRAIGRLAVARSAHARVAGLSSALIDTALVTAWAEITAADRAELLGPVARESFAEAMREEPDDVAQAHREFLHGVGRNLAQLGLASMLEVD